MVNRRGGVYSRVCRLFGLFPEDSAVQMTREWGERASPGGGGRERERSVNKQGKDQENDS